MIDWLELHNFRLYSRQEINLDKNLSIVIGDNAQGKTSLLEAVYYLHTLRSPLEKRQSRIIKFGEDYAKLNGSIIIESRNKKLDIKINLEGNKKKVFVNRYQLSKSSQLTQESSAVFLGPNDQKIITGDPQERRSFLDNILWKKDYHYADNWNNYMEVLKNRNQLLRTDNQDKLLMEIINSQLVDLGEIILNKRKAAISALTDLLNRIFDSNTKNKITLEYKPGAALEKKVFLQQLEDKIDYDQQMGFTSTGPHRDDLKIELDKKDAKIYASNGQKRLIAIALRWAEAQIIEEQTKEPPVILADDILAELDNDNSKIVLEILNSKNQVLLTSSNQDKYFTKSQKQGRVYKVKNGKITEN